MNRKLQKDQPHAFQDLLELELEKVKYSFHSMTIKQIRILTVAISIALYAFSLTQKCFCTGSSGCGDSIAVLVTGWMGFFSESFATFTWIANPVIFFSWLILFKDKKIAFISSSVATVICFSFLLFSKIIVNEGGVYSQITGYEIGYWAWCFSAVSMVAGSAVCFFKERKFPDK